MTVGLHCTATPDVPAAKSQAATTPSRARVFADQRRASAALDATIGAALRGACEDGTQLALQGLVKSRVVV